MLQKLNPYRAFLVGVRKIDGVDVLESDGERRLALYTSAFGWALVGAATLVASFTLPNVVPENIGVLRIPLAVIPLAAVIAHVTWFNRLSARGLYLGLNASACLASTCYLLLMVAAPTAAPATAGCMLLTIVYVGYFLRPREALLHMIPFTVVAAAPLLLSPSISAELHVAARLTVLIPIGWFMLIAILRQQRERKAAMERTRARAFTDPLTGLANQRAFRRAAEQRLSSRGDQPLGVVLIDIDDFKAINARWGQIEGDRVLRAVSAHLSRVARSEHLVARLGGDTFAALVPGTDRSTLDTVTAVCRGAVRGAVVDLSLGGLKLDASVGTAVAPDDGESLDELLTRAEVSLLASKTHHAIERLAEGRQPAMARGLRSVPLDDEAWPEDESPRVKRRILGLPVWGWRDPPPYAKFAAAAWLVGSITLLASNAMPDAHDRYSELVYAAAAGGLVAAVVHYFTAPLVGTVRYNLELLFSIVVIGAVTYLTGGSQGPGWLLVLLLVMYEGWFLSFDSALLRLAGPLLLIASPIAYEQPWNMVDADAERMIASIYTGLLVALLITFVISVARAHIEQMTRIARQLLLSDPLTELPNRRALRKQLEQLLDDLPAVSDPAHRPALNDHLALVVVDLDRFRSVNLAHGFRAGDSVLRSITSALQRVTETGVYLARSGGDEFAAIVPAAGADGARRVAERYVEAIEHVCSASPYDEVRYLSARAGFALCPLHGMTVPELLQAADTALLAVKTGAAGSQRVSRLVYAL